MPKFSANLTFLFTELPFLARFAAAKANGFDAVEYISMFDHEPEVIADHLHRHHLKLVLLNVPHGDWAAGERGIAMFPERTQEFRASIDQTIHYCRALDCHMVNCLAGIVPPDSDNAALRATFIENLKFAASALKAAGIRLLIEPLNTRDIPGFFLTGTKQAYDIIQDVASDNLFIQHDLYHMQIMEGDLAPTLTKYLASIGHIQIADNPGRHEPGTGEINYPFLLAHLERLGYPGHIGLEYKPSTTTLESLEWLKHL